MARILTPIVFSESDVTDIVDAHRNRHAEYAPKFGGSHANTAFLASHIITAILALGPETTKTLYQQFLPTFTPGWRPGTIFFANQTSALIEPSISVVLFHALGLDPGIPLAELPPLMTNVHVTEVEEMSRKERWEYGFFCLLIDAPRGWRDIGVVFAGHPLPPFMPHQTFEFNSQGLLRYLAAAIEVRAPLDAVRPAYRDYLANFQTLKHANESRLTLVFVIAAIVYHRIGGLPLTAVPDRLYQDHLANT